LDYGDGDCANCGEKRCHGLLEKAW
jgi:hypothetical protein